MTRVKRVEEGVEKDFADGLALTTSGGGGLTNQLQ